MASNHCKICQSPKCQDVDIDLINNVPYRTIAARYGFSFNGVKRHFKPDDGSPSHVKKPIIAAKEAEVIKNGKTLQERIDEIYDTSFGLVKMSVSQKDPRAAAYCLTNAVKVLEILNKGNEDHSSKSGLDEMRESIRAAKKV